MANESNIDSPIIDNTIAGYKYKDRLDQFFMDVSRCVVTSSAKYEYKLHVRCFIQEIICEQCIIRSWIVRFPNKERTLELAKWIRKSCEIEKRMRLYRTILLIFFVSFYDLIGGSSACYELLRGLQHPLPILSIL